MYTKLTPENASEIVQEATQRLQVLDSHIKNKQVESGNIEEKIIQLKNELEVYQVEVKKKNIELEDVKKSIESENKILQDLLKEEVEKQSQLTSKLRDLYKHIQEAKEELLRTVEKRTEEEELRATKLLDEVQEKRRTVIGLEDNIKVQETELMEKKKTVFNLQKKIDELHEKEQFIKKKYEDAGINYN